MQWRNLLNDADNRISLALDSAEVLIDQQTNLRIKDVEIRINNIKQITIAIIAGHSIRHHLCILFPSITNLHRLKESASTIGTSIAPSGYPNDEIGPGYCIFVAIDLKTLRKTLLNRNGWQRSVVVASVME